MRLNLLLIDSSAEYKYTTVFIVSEACNSKTITNDYN